MAIRKKTYTRNGKTITRYYPVTYAGRKELYHGGYAHLRDAKIAESELILRKKKSPQKDLTLYYLLERFELLVISDAKPNTAKNQCRHIVRIKGYFSDKTKVSSLSNYEWDKYIMTLRSPHELCPKGLSSGSARVYGQTLLQILKWAFEREYIGSNPFKNARLPKENEVIYNVLTSEEIALITSDVVSFPHRALIGLGALAGLRISEALGMKWENVHFSERSSIDLKTQWYEKEKKDVVLKSRHNVVRLSINSDMLEVLQEYFMFAGRPSSGYLFAGKHGVPFTQGTWARNHYHRIQAELGIGRHKFHELRHTFVTQLLEHGVPIQVVSKLARHSSPAYTLKKYAHYTLQADDSYRDFSFSGMSGKKKVSKSKQANE